MLFSPLLKGGYAPPTHRQEERQVPAWSSGDWMLGLGGMETSCFVGHTCLEVAPTETGSRGLGPEESK